MLPYCCRLELQQLTHLAFVDRTCAGSLLQCPFSHLQRTYAITDIHDDVGSAVEQDVVFSFVGVRRNDPLHTADAEWMV